MQISLDTVRKYTVYVLIRYAQTNVNYLLPIFYKSSHIKSDNMVSAQYTTLIETPQRIIQASLSRYTHHEFFI
jgi:hypothetical protein